MAGSVLSPLRRDRKRDFASDAGGALLASKVAQVLATEGATSKSSGELPWRTSFGAKLHTLRHQRNDLALAELARVFVRDALRTWLPEVQLVCITVDRDDNELSLRVRFRARDGAPDDVSVPIPTP
jgi:phage baseplate assembly protein W